MPDTAPNYAATTITNQYYLTVDLVQAQKLHRLFILHHVQRQTLFIYFLNILHLLIIKKKNNWEKKSLFFLIDWSIDW